jgi:hypothetical protein
MALSECVDPTIDFASGSAQLGPKNCATISEATSTQICGDSRRDIRSPAGAPLPVPIRNLKSGNERWS